MIEKGLQESTAWILVSRFNKDQIASATSMDLYVSCCAVAEAQAKSVPKVIKPKSLM